MYISKGLKIIHNKLEQVAYNTLQAWAEALLLYLRSEGFQSLMAMVPSALFEAQITGSEITKLKRSRAKSSNGLTKASGVLVENLV